MKILVVSQHYWPEPFTLPEICQELIRRGHTVHVLTDVPNYPMGYIYPEYRHGRRRNEEKNGVTIHRCFTIGRRQNAVFRILNYFSFAISSTVHALRMEEKYDVVFTNQTSPIMMVSAALAYARKHHRKCLLYCMDLWPASLAMGGISEKSLIYKVFGKISGILYRGADRILITSGMFREYLQEQFGIKADTIHYLPQYAPDLFSEAAVPAEKEDGTVNLLFAGNVGVAQSIPTILQAAKLLEENPALRWHIVGDGSELAHAKQLSRELGLKNVIFHGRKPMEEMPGYYAMADAMLVTLTADPFISLTLPAKVQSCMAAGKPIIAAANGEIPNAIQTSGCGFCAGAEDARGLADAVTQFLNCPDPRVLGENGKKYYLDHFTQKVFIDTLEQQLEEFCQ